MTDTPERQRHWNKMYASRASDEVSWFQQTPSTSLRLLDQAGAGAAT